MERVLSGKDRRDLHNDIASIRSYIARMARMLTTTTTTTTSDSRGRLRLA
jgi:hypothetical protein